MLTALYRFHLATSIPVALRAAVPVVAGLTAAVVLAPSPAAALASLLLAVAGPRPVPPVAAAALLAVFLVVATAVVRRSNQGLGGWPRSLPASDRDHRVALVLAVASALATFPLGALAAAAVAGLPIDGARVLGGLIAGVAAPLAALPTSRRVLAAPLALVAGWIALELGWAGLAAGAALAASAFPLAGTLRRSGVAGRLAGTGKRRSGLETWIVVRALGWRAVGPAAAAAAVLAGGLAFAVNNELAPSIARAAWRLTAVTGATVAAAGLAELMAVRRPTWPWARSLPRSASRRVLHDAALLGAPALVVTAIAAAADLAAAAVAAAAVPPLALLASGAVRRAAERASGAFGEVLAGGLLAGAWITLVPALAWVLLAASPLLLRWAADRDRRLRVSSWLERHHLAAGDPLSWSEGG